MNPPATNEWSAAADALARLPFGGFPEINAPHRYKLVKTTRGFWSRLAEGLRNLRRFEFRWPAAAHYSFEGPIRPGDPRYNEAEYEAAWVWGPLVTDKGES